MSETPEVLTAERVAELQGCLDTAPDGTRWHVGGVVGEALTDLYKWELRALLAAHSRAASLERELADSEMEFDVLQRLYDDGWAEMDRLAELAGKKLTKANCPELCGATDLATMLLIVGDIVKERLGELAEAREGHEAAQFALDGVMGQLAERAAERDTALSRLGKAEGLLRRHSQWCANTGNLANEPGRSCAVCLPCCVAIYFNDDDGGEGGGNG